MEQLGCLSGKILALDLLSESDPDEEGNRYTFEFIDEDHVGLNRNNLWFKVGDILGMESGPSMSDWIHDHGLDRNSTARPTASSTACTGQSEWTTLWPTTRN